MVQSTHRSIIADDFLAIDIYRPEVNEIDVLFQNYVYQVCLKDELEGVESCFRCSLRDLIARGLPSDRKP